MICHYDDREMAIKILRAVAGKPFVLRVTPGQARPHEIADVFLAMSDLARAAGGLGLDFEVFDVPGHPDQFDVLITRDEEFL